MGGLTLAAEENGEVPQLGHVERLEDLTLVGSSIAVKRDGGVLLALVLVCESQTSTDRNLSADDTVATVEALCEHVHGSSLSVRDTLTTAEKLADDGLDGSTAHQSESVTSVGGDDVVFLGDGVLDSDGYGFLSGGQMAEATDLLFLV